MASSRKDGLSRAGLYFDGIIEESKLQEVLELHKRDTVSTFGTRSSRRVSKNCNRTEQHQESVIGSSSDETTLAVDKENVCLQSEGAAEELAAPEHKVVGINIMHKVVHYFFKSIQKGPKLYWKHKVGSHVIQFEDMPFSLGEKRTLDCQYGTKYYKSKPHFSDRVFLQGTRKKGCQAHIQILEFCIYPQYGVKTQQSQSLSLKKTRNIRESSLKRLREVLTNNEVLQTTHKYFVSLPTEEAHHKCHSTKGVMGLSQRIHPELILKIQEFVSVGTIEPVEVQRLLIHLVKQYMCAGKLPDANDRAYYPSLGDIKNHIAKAKRALQLSVMDQENAAKLTERWEKLSPDSHYLFRPYKHKDDTDSCKKMLHESHATDFERTLLWVHQEAWQQELMLTYGNTISLMDATYKTTRYDLPLFFVCVRTNSGYCVVAEFIVQSESAKDIEEAIRVLRSWNPEWKPKFFMTDYSEAEIAALETCFPDTKVYLCDFHREQAWERWTRDSSHGLSTDDSEFLLEQLRACAWAPSTTPAENLPLDHNYLQAVDALKSSNLWKNNPQVSQWLNSTWLTMPEVSEHYSTVWYSI